MVLATQTRQRLGIALTSKAAGKDLADNVDNADGIELLDGVDMSFGTGDDALIRWSEADVSNPAMVIAVGDTSQALHVTDKGAVATDWNIVATTHPNIYVHSNTTPATDYIRLGGHDGTIADIDVVGGTTLRLMAAGVAMTTITATAVTLADAQNIVVNATTGTKIGTATSQKLGFFNATPIVQPSAVVSLETVLSNLGLRAAGTAAPLSMGALDVGTITVAEANNIVVAGSTGMKIGTATTQKLSFYNATPIVQGLGLTAQSTTITHSAPGTPDFAVQDLVANTGFGFVTADEGQTVLSVIANLQARLAEVEARLEATGLIAAN